ncbi:MAG: NADH-quinone oxidoreductase subunit D [Armatimonadota bacterium]
MERDSALTLSAEEPRLDLATERIVLNMGPQHPSTHGVLRVVATLDGEVIVNADPRIGYLHSSAEKICEARTYQQLIPFLDRFDYLSAIFWEDCLCRAVEEHLGLEVPARARYLRTLASELNRIASHLVWLGTFALDIGAITPFLYCFRDREYILDMFEEICGARMTYNYLRIGGVSHDIPEEVAERCRWFCDYLPGRLVEIDRILTRNRIFIGRTRRIGVLSPEQAVNWGCSGPMLRGSGVAFDLRKAQPYEAYRDIEFDVVTRQDGDVLARYEVRVGEMHESLKIVRQCLDRLPGGEFFAKPKGRLRPEGEFFARVESPRGELAMYVLGDGTDKPSRLKIRAPSFCNLAVLSELARGVLVADLVAVLGSIDIILGDVDR